MNGKVIGGSIFAATILVLVSFVSMVGYQTITTAKEIHDWMGEQNLTLDYKNILNKDTIEKLITVDIRKELGIDSDSIIQKWNVILQIAEHNLALLNKVITLKEKEIKKRIQDVRTLDNQNQVNAWIKTIDQLNLHSLISYSQKTPFTNSLFLSKDNISSIILIILALIIAIPIILLIIIITIIIIAICWIKFRESQTQYTINVHVVEGDAPLKDAGVGVWPPFTILVLKSNTLLKNDTRWVRNNTDKNGYCQIIIWSLFTQRLLTVLAVTPDHKKFGSKSFVLINNTIYDINVTIKK